MRTIPAADSASIATSTAESPVRVRRDEVDVGEVVEALEVLLVVSPRLAARQRLLACRRRIDRRTERGARQGLARGVVRWRHARPGEEAAETVGAAVQCWGGGGVHAPAAALSRFPPCIA